MVIGISLIFVQSVEYSMPTTISGTLSTITTAGLINNVNGSQAVAAAYTTISNLSQLYDAIAVNKGTNTITIKSDFLTASGGVEVDLISVEYSTSQVFITYSATHPTNSTIRTSYRLSI